MRQLINIVFTLSLAATILLLILGVWIFALISGAALALSLMAAFTMLKRDGRLDGEINKLDNNL